MTHRPARFLDSIAQIDALKWNSLAGSAQPFLRHEFLLALVYERNLKYRVFFPSFAQPLRSSR